MSLENDFINQSFWRDIQIAAVETIQWGLNRVTCSKEIKKKKKEEKISAS